MAGDKALGLWPAPGTSNAPAWYDGKPEELERWLRNIRQQIKARSLVDQEAKEFILNYASSQTERLWKTLPAFEAGKDVEDFLKEIEDEYPELPSLTEGSISALEKVCNQFRDLDLADYSSVARFSRLFRVEANPLIEGGVLANAGAVRLIERCF